jgi:hypothetical protein
MEMIYCSGTAGSSTQNAVLSIATTVKASNATK